LLRLSQSYAERVRSDILRQIHHIRASQRRQRSSTRRETAQTQWLGDRSGKGHSRPADFHIRSCATTFGSYDRCYHHFDARPPRYEPVSLFKSHFFRLEGLGYLVQNLRRPRPHLRVFGGWRSSDESEMDGSQDGLVLLRVLVYLKDA